MSGIINRTALVDTSKGYPNFLDYSLVSTALGTMIEVGEPIIYVRGSGIFPDKKDQFQRVDGLTEFNEDKISILFREV